MFPKYDTNLDPLRLVGLDRCLYTVADGNVAFEKGGGVLHIVLIAPPPHGGYASCWRIGAHFVLHILSNTEVC